MKQDSWPAALWNGSRCFRLEATRLRVGPARLQLPLCRRLDACRLPHTGRTIVEKFVAATEEVLQLQQPGSPALAEASLQLAAAFLQLWSLANGKVQLDFGGGLLAALRSAAVAAKGAAAAGGVPTGLLAPAAARLVSLVSEAFSSPGWWDMKQGPPLAAYPMHKLQPAQQLQVARALLDLAGLGACSGGVGVNAHLEAGAALFPSLYILLNSCVESRRASATDAEYTVIVGLLARASWVAVMAAHRLFDAWFSGDKPGAAAAQLAASNPRLLADTYFGLRHLTDAFRYEMPGPRQRSAAELVRMGIAPSSLAHVAALSPHSVGTPAGQLGMLPNRLQLGPLAAELLQVVVALRD